MTWDQILFVSNSTFQLDSPLHRFMYDFKAFVVLLTQSCCDFEDKVVVCSQEKQLAGSESRFVGLQSELDAALFQQRSLRAALEGANADRKEAQRLAEVRDGPPIGSWSIWRSVDGRTSS